MNRLGLATSAVLIMITIAVTFGWFFTSAVVASKPPATVRGIMIDNVPLIPIDNGAR